MEKTKRFVIGFRVLSDVESDSEVKMMSACEVPPEFNDTLPRYEKYAGLRQKN